MVDVLLLVLLVCHSGRQPAASDELPLRVDRIELNHYQWSNAFHTTHQVIFWRWSATEGRYKVVGFHFVASDGSEDPHRADGKWHFSYQDKKSDRVKVRLYESDDLIETVTDYDPWRRALQQ